MKIKKNITIGLISLITIFLLISQTQAASSLWKYTSSLLQPVVNTWNIYAPANLRFDGEIQPDGATCSNGQILKKTGANDWDCASDATGAGGQAIVFDIGDDGGDDSTDLGEIATTGDTNTIFTEPSADKMLIAVGNNWPTSDTADALSANPAAATAGYCITDIAANGSVEGEVDVWTEAENTAASYISATLTQEEVEDYAGALIGDGTGTHTGIAVTYQDATGDVDMVIDHDAATNFVANEHIDWTGVGAGTINTDNYIEGHSNGANCVAGNSPLGVDDSGAVENCFDVWTEAENTAAGYTDFSPTDLDTDYGNETITSTFIFNDAGSTGAFGAYDITIGGGNDGYGGIRIGDGGIYKSSYVTGNIDLGQAFVIRNENALDAGNDPGIEFAFIESVSNFIRFAIPESASGNATYNARSLIVAGPYSAAVGNDIVTCNQWSAYDSNIDCDTSGTGADLFIQDDFELEGEIYSSGTIHTDADDTNQHIQSTANQTASHTWTWPDDQIANGDLLVGNGAGTFVYTAKSSINLSDFNDDLSHTADEVGVLTTGDLCVNDGSAVQCTVNTEAELETALDAINVLIETEIDASSELLSIMDDETGTGALCFATSPTIATPSLTLEDGNGADPTTDGQIKYDRTSEVIEIGDGVGTQYAAQGDSAGACLVGDSATAFFSSGSIEHEYGGLEADVNTYSGLLAISGGSTLEVDAKSELEAQIADVSDFAEADGDIFTGIHDFGGADSFELVNNATTCTTDATGEMCFDINGDGTNNTTMILQAYDGSAPTYYFGVREAPTTNNQVMTYDSAAHDIKWAVPTGSGDITDVWSVSSGDVNQPIIGTGEYLDGGTTTVDSTSEGILLPRGTSCVAATSEAQICWDTDDDNLYVGNGSGVTEITGGGGGGSGSTTLHIPLYSAKISGVYVTASIANLDTATKGADIDAGDGNWRLLFDDTTDEAAVFMTTLPSNYSSTPVINIIYSMASGTANEVEWESAIQCTTPGDSEDIGTETFAAGAVDVETVPGTVGYTDSLISITPTDDSCAAGDLIYIYVSTDANDATNDDATGDRELVDIYLSFTGA